jgi:Flp pilus assembly protein TadD
LKQAPDLFLAHRRLAEALVADGNTPGAITEFKEASRLNPMDATTHVQFAKLYASQGKTDDASNEYRKALDANPNSAVAKDGLAELAKTKSK